MRPDDWRQEVLDAGCRMIASLGDGNLRLISVSEDDNGEVWKVQHFPNDVDPILDIGMKAIRQGEVRPKDAVSGEKVYVFNVYGGREHLLRTREGGWQIVDVPVSAAAVSERDLILAVRKIREQSAKFSPLDARAISTQAVILNGVDLETHKEVSYVLAFDERGELNEIRKVSFEDDPSPEM